MEFRVYLSGSVKASQGALELLQGFRKHSWVLWEKSVLGSIFRVFVFLGFGRASTRSSETFVNRASKISSGFQSLRGIQFSGLRLLVG